MDRKATIERNTKETTISVTLDLEGGESAVETGIPFFNHMLDQLAKHSGIGLLVKSDGDLEVDAHHTVEDVGISIGEALNSALGEKLGIRRFASVSVPLDEALVDVALDISGRAFCNYEIDFPGEKILGDPPFDPQLVEEFWRAFTATSKVTLHISLVRGKNTHHIIEATFKGVARALRDAIKIESSDLPSTKGSL
ncbi:MAG: imidazoleglycerol-phosphate dehydratase HisB [Actinomycetota bacterium]|nr:imidazoleglycerol-phosphate dehydratase [Acidimicrobiaceae bacterium]MEC7899652.1 imidazoleglycerol-phosphate dehydratase HisB [Actinomycetota bacterium]|tara:strand:- start:3600 stop:4187 length:588 start_codon:yes stop_codon:yes gene_type:complete